MHRLWHYTWDYVHYHNLIMDIFVVIYVLRGGQNMFVKEWKYFNSLQFSHGSNICVVALVYSVDRRLIASQVPKDAGFVIYKPLCVNLFTCQELRHRQKLHTFIWISYFSTTLQRFQERAIWEVKAKSSQCYWIKR